MGAFGTKASPGYVLSKLAQPEMKPGNKLEYIGVYM